MNTGYEGQTVAVKGCTSCGGGLLEFDRFCRWCGVSQTGGLHANELYYAALPTARLDQTAAGASSGLRRVSGPLISAVIDGMATGPAAQRGSVMRTSILALISIPIWLMIVLLSPFDAFAAARSLARQV